MTNDAALTRLDIFLQRWRRRRALECIVRGSRLLDIGTHDGGLFAAADAHGVGIDPELAAASEHPGVILIKGFFPDDLPAGENHFDVATALAVVEHVHEDDLRTWAARLAELVRPGGRIVITVPSPAVDKILHVLMRLRLVAGIEAHQHHGFSPDTLETVFGGSHWRAVLRTRFQLGLNNLFVFERVEDAKITAQ